MSNNDINSLYSELFGYLFHNYVDVDTLGARRKTKINVFSTVLVIKRTFALNNHRDLYATRILMTTAKVSPSHLL